MRSCGSLSDTRAREVEGVGAVDLIVSPNRGVGLTFLQAGDLGTLEVGTTSIKFVSAFEVEENLLQNSEVTSTLSTTLSASKFEFFLCSGHRPQRHLSGIDGKPRLGGRLECDHPQWPRKDRHLYCRRLEAICCEWI